MHLQPGTLLISTPSLDDSVFEKVVIFITEHNEKGAMGFVVNKIFSRTFNELVEFKDSVAFPLYEGGPVENGNLFFLHQRPDIIEAGTVVIESIHIGGDFVQAVTHLNNKSINQKDIKLLIGYCGWDHNQLEEEIEEGSWLLCNANRQLVFSANPEMLWDEIHKAQV